MAADSLLIKLAEKPVGKILEKTSRKRMLRSPEDGHDPQRRMW
jgi:hypothetical protein